METSTKFNTVLLIIITILLGVIIWFLLGQRTPTEIVEDVPGTDVENSEDDVSTTGYIPPTPLPQPTPTPSPTPTNAPLAVQLIYKKGQTGIISQCEYKGELVYMVGMNAYDGGNTIYNDKGVAIDSVSGFSGKSENGIAEDVTDCKDIYVVTPNIWGKAGVDIYNLN